MLTQMNNSTIVTASNDENIVPSTKRRRSNDDQPIFLRKAHQMINNCPPELGGWTDGGDTFVIKDSNVFAEKVIPCYYKHNNFSSFVRQLNFYGFRKVKSPIQSSWWEFRHTYFLRDQPHLISEIKKCLANTKASVSSNVSTSENSSNEEVEQLKHQVTELQERLNETAFTVKDLSELVADAMSTDECSKHYFLTTFVNMKDAMKSIIPKIANPQKVKNDAVSFSSSSAVSSSDSSDNNEFDPNSEIVYDVSKILNLFKHIPPLFPSPVEEDDDRRSGASSPLTDSDSFDLPDLSDMAVLINGLHPILQFKFLELLAERLTSIFERQLKQSSATDDVLTEYFDTECPLLDTFKVNFKGDINIRQLKLKFCPVIRIVSLYSVDKV